MQEAYEAVWDAIMPITAASKNFLSLNGALWQNIEKSYDMSLAWPAAVQLLVLFYSVIQ